MAREVVGAHGGALAVGDRCDAPTSVTRAAGERILVQPGCVTSRLACGSASRFCVCTAIG